MGRPVRGVLSALAALLLVWWFLRGADLAAVVSQIRQVHLGYLSAAVVLSLTSMVYRAWRWRYLVSPLKLVSLPDLAACVFMGWAVTAMLPGRMGEMARPVLLGHRVGIRKMAVFGTVVLERGLDMLAVLVLLAIYLSVFSRTLSSGSQAEPLVSALRSGGWAIFTGLAALTALVIVVTRLPPEVETRFGGMLSRRMGRQGERGWAWLRSFGEGVTGALTSAGAGMSTHRLRAHVGLHTVGLWILICGVHALLFRAFGLDLPFPAVLPLVSMAVVGLAVPVPAAVGSYHSAVQLGLTLLLGIHSDLAAGYAIVSHAVAFLPSGTIGLVLLAREGVSWSSLTGR